MGGIVCNDIGVYDGGEISMYYDLMIVKLCIWGEICQVVIEEMCVVLDIFEVEGIGYNLLFVVVVMDYFKFVFGDMIMVFIVEEYLDGFEGVILLDVDLNCLVVVLVVMNCFVEVCCICILGCMLNYECCVGDEWVVLIQGVDIFVIILVDEVGLDVVVVGEIICVISDWMFGDSIVKFFVGGVFLVLKVGKIM